MPELKKVKEYYDKRQKRVKITSRKILLTSYLMPYVHQKKVIDIGCGDGFITTILARWCSIKGYDLSTEVCKKAFPAIPFFDITQNLPREADCILLLDVLEHIEEKEEFRFLEWWSAKTDMVIINIPIHNKQEQIIDRHVSIPDLITRMDKLSFSLDSLRTWNASAKEEYKLMVFKHNES